METFNLSEIKAVTVVRKSRSCCLKNKMAELNNKTKKIKKIKCVKCVRLTLHGFGF